MDNLLKLLPPAWNGQPLAEYPSTPPALTHPLPCGLLVIAGPHAASQGMLLLCARLAQLAPIQVIDAGNRFNAYHVARALASSPPTFTGERPPSPQQILKRIRVARAFTCYQVTAMLEQIPKIASPLLILDLLDTFFDESASLAERRRLLKRCITLLQRHARQSPVIASLRPPLPGQPEPTGFVQSLQSAADLFWEMPFPENERSQQPHGTHPTFSHPGF